MKLILRPYQEEACNNVMRCITEGIKKVCTVLSTGSGKTIILIEVAKRFLKINTGKKILVLSNSSILTEQNKDRFEQFSDLKVGILQADRIPNRDCDVVIATVQSAKIDKKIKSWIGMYTHDIGMVIVDEMHDIQTKSYDDALGYFEDAIIYGTTASPYRDRQVMTNYFDIIAYTISMQELIDLKYLVPLTMKQILSSNDRLAQTVELYKRNELGCKAGIFLKTTEEAKNLRNLFQSNNINAEVILGTTSKATRKTVIDGFNNGDIDILCTCNVISKGFDSHKLEVIMMPYGTRSPTLFTQRIGRGSRPQDGDSVKPRHSKQDCRIYMFGDAPCIKRGLYKRLQNFVLQDGSDKLDIHDELEYLEVIGEDKTSQVYKWTADICELSLQLKALGKLKIDEMIREKKFPKRYLKNPTLLSKGLSGDYKDDMGSFIQNVKRQIEADKSQNWIISDGLNVGKNVTEMHNFQLLKLIRSKVTSQRTKELIKQFWAYKRRLKLDKTK